MVDLKSEYDRKVHSLGEIIEKQKAEIEKLKSEKKVESESSKAQVRVTKQNLSGLPVCSLFEFQPAFYFGALFVFTDV